MRNVFAKIVLLSAITATTVAVPEASAARTQADQLRSQVVRLHARLSREALDSPEVAAAHAESAKAYAALYQIRENILVDLRKRDDYSDLKLALWHQQQMLQGQHLEVPIRVTSILLTAGDSMSLRSRLGKMEVEALEASAEFVAARNTMNTLVAAERQAIAEAVETVRSDPQFVALSEQLRNTQGSFVLRGVRRS